MPHQRLQAIIEQAFEDRATITSQTKGEVRDAVTAALGLARQRAGARRRENPGRGRRRLLESQSMAEEGGAAVVPPQRQRR